MLNKIYISLLVVFTVSQSSFSSTTPDVSQICKTPSSSDGILELRSKYVCEIEHYLPLVKAGLEETEISNQEQAEILNGLRREIGKKYKDLTPSWLRGYIYCRNLKVYKDPLGPTHESLIAKGKTNQDIIESSMRTGGKDIVLDNRIAASAVDFVTYMEWGPYAQWAGSFFQDNACGSI